MAKEEIKLKKLPAHFKDLWLEALRSGEYKQVRGFLHTDKGFCCLGVACDLTKAKPWDDEIHLNSAGIRFRETRATQSEDYPRGKDLPARVMKVLDQRYGSQSVMDHLISMNDDGKRFKTIAKWIESHL